MVDFTHTLHNRTRYFHNKSCKNVSTELNASKSDVLSWYNQFRAFDTIVPGKSYAQALLSNVNGKVNNLKHNSECHNHVNENTDLVNQKYSPHYLKVTQTKHFTRGTKKLNQTKLL